jgi:Ca2+-binding EF-hand superfamily protein
LSALQALHIPAHYKYAKDLFNVCDADKDGRLDYPKFRHYMDGRVALPFASRSTMSTRTTGLHRLLQFLCSFLFF